MGKERKGHVVSDLWFLEHYINMARNMQGTGELLNGWLAKDMTFENIDCYPDVMDSLYNSVAVFRDQVYTLVENLEKLREETDGLSKIENQSDESGPPW